MHNFKEEDPDLGSLHINPYQVWTKTSYLFEVVVNRRHWGTFSGQSHQVPIRPQSLLAWQGRGRLLLLVRGRGLFPNGTIARIAHLLKIITYLRKGLYKG